MKVLKFKKIKEFRVKEKCPYCNAVLELEENDIEFMPLLSWGDLSRFGQYIYTCPICNKHHHLSDNNYNIYSLYEHTKQLDKEKENENRKTND